MAEPPPTRMMNFVSEHQLDQARKARGERVEDGTAQRDKPLYEILKENKDKRDAEFSERFKHRPPKALDEDETEFLDNVEMSKRNYEKKMADDEAQKLRSFQEAVSAHTSVVYDLKETPLHSRVEDKRAVGKKNPPGRPFGSMIMVKPLKKQKTDAESSPDSMGLISNAEETTKWVNADTIKPQLPEEPKENNSHAKGGRLGGLVSYSDESDDDSSSV